MIEVGVWTDLRESIRSDRVHYGAGARLLRSLRVSRALIVASAQRDLVRNHAYRRHVERVAPGDRFFWISHRSYLATRLTLGQRLRLAHAHYHHEVSRFGVAYLSAIYDDDGLPLWTVDRNGVSYELRLMPGNDVLYEGGLSIVLFVDGERVCVLSFSWAPASVVLGQSQGLVPFITRKQLTGQRNYQEAFHKAFDRTTPSHLCLSALAGLAQTLGHERIFGIAAARHPSVAPQRREQFEAAYDQFWTSVGGLRASPLGFLMTLPLRLASTAAMEPRKRRRALARRAHMEAVNASARDRISPFLSTS